MISSHIKGQDRVRANRGQMGEEPLKDQPSTPRELDIRPSGNPADAGERLARLDALADSYVPTQRPSNTLRAYAADWRIWQDYTAELGIPLLSGTRGALVGFVLWLERGRTTRTGDQAPPAAPATVERRLTGAVVGLRRHHARVEPDATKAAWQALNGYRRRLAEDGVEPGRGKAAPVTVAHLRAMSLSCPNTLAGVRDRAMLLIGFPIASRASDLANLWVGDITTPDAHGLVVRVRHGKSTGEMAVPRGRHPQTCPVRAWDAWRTAANLDTGPAFRRIDRHDNAFDAGLSAAAVTKIITRCGERAGLPFPITGHSLRSGMATESRRSGADVKAIASQGRWSPTSTALYGYLHQVDRWNDNAARDLGL